MLAPVQLCGPRSLPGPRSRAIGPGSAWDLSQPQAGADGVLNSPCCSASQLPNAGCWLQGPAGSDQGRHWALSTFMGSARHGHATPRALQLPRLSPSVPPHHMAFTSSVNTM